MATRAPRCPILSRRAAAGRAELLAKSAHAGHLRLPAEPLEVAEKFGKNSGKIRETSKGSEFGIPEKCCILEKSRKNLVKFGENSAKFWQKLRNFGKKQQKIQQFLTKILRLESGGLFKDLRKMETSKQESRYIHSLFSRCFSAAPFR